MKRGILVLSLFLISILFISGCELTGLTNAIDLKKGSDSSVDVSPSKSSSSSSGYKKDASDNPVVEKIEKIPYTFTLPPEELEEELNLPSFNQVSADDDEIKVKQVEKVPVSNNNLFNNIANFFRNLFGLEVQRGGLDCELNEVDLGWGDCNNYPSYSGTGCMGSGCYSIETTEILRLPESGLTGPISLEIAQLTSLRQIYLNKNQLSGEIPVEIFDLDLIWLELSENEFSGWIPPEIGNMQNIMQLKLQENKLSGLIPDSICDLEINHEIPTGFNLEYNNLCIQAWPDCIPVTYQTYQDTTDCTIYGCMDQTALNYNPEAEEEFPEGYGEECDYCSEQVELWGNLYCVETTTVLNLENTNLTGEIPESIGSLSYLNTLNLDNNQLTGEIPESICNLRSLKKLSISNNNLGGMIPSCIVNLVNLHTLILSNNNLIGEIPDSIGDLTQLGSYGGVFWLHNNQLSGVIPESICNLSSYLLDNPDIHGIFLKLNNNQLCPPYPECIGRYAIGTQGTSFDNGDGGWENCDSCSTVELWEIPCSQCTNGDGGNEWNTCNTELPPSPTSGLNGEIPDVISEFTELRAIIMFDKQLVGEIPEWIGDLKSLREINLGNNQLTGAIPPEIFNLAWIQDLDLKNNQLTGKLPDNIGNLGSESSYPLSNGIDLRNNQLKGNIPESFPWYPCFSLSENNFISVPDDVCVFWPPPYECGVFGYYNQFHNNQLCEGSYPGCIYVGTQDTSECVDDCPPDSYSCSQWDGNEYRCDNVVESQNNGCFYCDPNDLTNDETYDNHCNPANINQCVCMSSTYGCCYTGGPPSYDPGTWCRIDEDCRSGTICCAGKCELDGACGDRDGNGIINVLDIVVLADYILYDSCNELDYACATDLNEDTFFNVLDLVTLANCILAGNCGG